MIPVVHPPCDLISACVMASDSDERGALERKDKEIAYLHGKLEKYTATIEDLQVWMCVSAAPASRDTSSSSLLLFTDRSPSGQLHEEVHEGSAHPHYVSDPLPQSFVGSS